jgi:hypothetical protein
MDNKPKHRLSRRAKENALKTIGTSSTKKRSVSPHGRAGHPQKARKRTPLARVDKSAEDVGTQFHRTPATKRRASHNNSTEHEAIISASGMENQIAEARGVTRKNIPWDKFCSTYLCDFSVKAQPKLAVESVKKIVEGNWEEKPFGDRLRKVLSDKVRC